MSNLPALTEADVTAWLGAHEVSKGRPYQSAVLNPRTQGQHLKAMVQGTASQPYRVNIVLEIGEISRGHCSCPVGDGGCCKHVAALLLSWVHQPERFSEVEALEERLEQKGKGDLITLILKMLERHPDLETLVAMPEPADISLDPNIIRRQVLSALDNTSYADDDYEQELGLSTAAYRDLLELVDLTDRTLLQGDVASATTAYGIIANELLENHEQYEDLTGSLAEVVGRCAEGLASCLAATTDEARRADMLRVLFDIYRWAGEYDSGSGVAEMILEYATVDEREQVATWVRQVMPGPGGFANDYQRRALGDFLLKLEADRLDDEAFLRICRESGRIHDLVRRLLELERPKEAVREAERTENYSLLQLAELFKEAGHPDNARQLVLERSKGSDDRRILEWLLDDFEKQGNLHEALDLAKTLFWQHPHLNGYQKIKALAEQRSVWKGLKPTLLSRLHDEERYTLLTEIQLFEQNIEAALELIQQKKPRFGWYSEALIMQVASAAKKKRPLEAIRLYQTQIDKLIAARGRENYARAGEYLLQVVELYEGLGEDEAWHSYIGGIKNKKPRLPALLEELDRVGL